MIHLENNIILHFTLHDFHSSSFHHLFVHFLPSTLDNDYPPRFLSSSSPSKDQLQRFSRLLALVFQSSLPIGISVHTIFYRLSPLIKIIPHDIFSMSAFTNFPSTPPHSHAFPPITISCHNFTSIVIPDNDWLPLFSFPTSGRENGRRMMGQGWVIRKLDIR